MMLRSVVLDVAPHFLDGAVEGAVGLFLAGDEVVRILAGAAGLLERGGGEGG